jgi:serine/threonine protein kinase
MSYTRIRELGAGGFSKVYLVSDESGYKFAMKVFDPQQAIVDAVGEDNLKRRFKREVLYQQSIDHPNVVKIISHDLDADPPFFVMELAECTLSDELQQDRTLGGDPKQALYDILTGLEAIHGLGIIHRDLKPQNVLKIRNNGSCRYAVSDFGLVSSSLTQSTTLTQSNATGGTPRYAAPELIRDFKRGTHLSDVYSFGVILFDIFGGGEQRIPYTEINSVAGAIGVIISTCTKKLPKRRYDSIATLRAVLYDALQDETIIFSSPEEERIIELLKTKDELQEAEWDDVFFLIDDNIDQGRTNHNIFKAITYIHLQQLGEESPQLLASLGHDFCEYIIGTGFDFDYCDVLGNKLQSFFNCGSIELKAESLLALLELGTGHNRWYVERIFIKLAGHYLPDSVASRVAIEVQIRNIDFERLIERLEQSISVSRDDLHPALRALL